MHTKSILTAAAIAFVAGLGSASAGGQFITVDGIPAQPIVAEEIANIRGSSGIVLVFPGVGVVPLGANARPFTLEHVSPYGTKQTQISIPPEMPAISRKENG